MADTDFDDRQNQMLKLLEHHPKTEGDECEELVKFTLNPRYDFGNRRLEFKFVIETVKETNLVATYGASLFYKDDDDVERSIMDGGGDINTNFYSGFIFSGPVEADGQTRQGSVLVGGFILNDGVYTLCFKNTNFLYHT